MHLSLPLSFWLCGSLSVLVGFVFICLCLLSCFCHCFGMAPGLSLNYLLVAFSLLSLTASLPPPPGLSPAPSAFRESWRPFWNMQQHPPLLRSGPGVTGQCGEVSGSPPHPHIPVGTQAPDCSLVQPAVGFGRGWVFPDPWKARTGLGLAVPAWSSGTGETEKPSATSSLGRNVFWQLTLHGHMTSANDFLSLSLCFPLFKMGRSWCPSLDFSWPWPEARCCTQRVLFTTVRT